MKAAADYLSGWLGILGWLAGVVYAQGFWLTALAIFFPPFGWYLCMERLLRAAGWL